MRNIYFFIFASCEPLTAYMSGAISRASCFFGGVFGSIAGAINPYYNPIIKKIIKLKLDI